MRRSAQRNGLQTKVVGDFGKNTNAEEDMESIMNVLRSFEGEGKILRVEGGGR